MSTIFANLGIYGMPEHQENALLASLLTGDPALLIGKQGTAKTGLITAIGAAMNQSTRRKFPDDSEKWIRYHAYDSSKINFEDLIGIPNVHKFAEGKMEYIESPQTAWDKDMICFDEFNRQLPERQNNLFELIRSRSLMGTETKCKWVFNCMNPAMEGTEVLDAAIVDRHLWFMYVKDFNSLNEEAKLAVTTHVGHHDAPALKRVWLKKKAAFDIDEHKVNDTLADVGDSLFNLMELAAIKYEALMDEVGKAYGHFVSRYITALTAEMSNKDWKVELSGRRAGMIHRGLIAFRAVQLAKAELFSCKLVSSKESAKTALMMSIPVGIAEANPNGLDSNAASSIKANVEAMSQFFACQGDDAMIAAIETLSELMHTTSLARKIEILTTEVTDEHSKNQAWSDIVSPRNKPQEGSDEDIKRKILINIVAHLITANPDSVPLNFHKHIITEASKTKGMSGLFSEINLKGAAALRARDIETDINKYKSPFVRLQAKITYASELKNMNTLDRQQFTEIKMRVSAECASLQEIIEQGATVDFTAPNNKDVNHATAVAKSAI